METKVIVNHLTDYVNSFSNKAPEFCAAMNDVTKAMSNEHRTLQQSFTSLCLAWIQFVASDEYRYDLRNEGSHKRCKEIMDLFKAQKEKEGWTKETLELMCNISQLPCI